MKIQIRLIFDITMIEKNLKIFLIEKLKKLKKLKIIKNLKNAM